MNWKDYNIPFNKPYQTGREASLIQEVYAQGKLSGNGAFTQRCQNFLENIIGSKKCLLTQSGTTALELMALLLDIKEGDEVILPSYTFVSTANAFALRGAKLVFVDTKKRVPVLDENIVEARIGPKTKAIIAVHYAGVACNMKALGNIARDNNIYLLEDAAQALGSFYYEKPLGSFGGLAAFSFHETKNISAGEGGCLMINDPRLVERAEILWEKGTDRAAFFRGEKTKYQWQDLGSSFLPSEITAAFLWGQLEDYETIQQGRRQAWDYYDNHLPDLLDIYQKPYVPKGTNHNGHGYYLFFKNKYDREDLRGYLGKRGILALAHYEPLHQSPYYLANFPAISLRRTEKFADCLLRLPLYNSISKEEQSRVIDAIGNWSNLQIKKLKSIQLP
ncbi:dTDP-4-amino-4,6-dideoxygalactose transaminase [Echinicola jeungdonensis]|uniref:dTDP-4-amino-4,6-dideoxygalactose transaminase n=1 Tax=Echinicola jeungdonensis TaxID=709343 RepID=A0ABV5J9K5_9BACT|nr:dTDP-4-amino-4,6-dideoxygalactose transaminase [Echinicola jeungdonensis]MDN3669967.1 dTDP-4-amino-4,6-dideoxygalactose transaminase [Echinicola jeungdonensis]